MAFSRIVISASLVAGLGFSVIGNASTAYAEEPAVTASPTGVQTFQYAYTGTASLAARGAFTASAPAPTPTPEIVAAPTADATTTASAAPQVVAVPAGSAQQIAAGLVGDPSQFSCLVQLWNKESGWRTNASNPSGAYGIPQALPGSKMASAGADWRTNPATQIKWGLSYISGQYGTPCGAWAHSQRTGWY
jgi:hypothetical protein